MPTFTVSQVDEKQAGALLRAFLTDECLNMQEADFKNSRKALSAHFNAGVSIPKAEEIQKVFEDAGQAAMCVGSFSIDSKKNLITMSLLPGSEGKIRIMTGVYAEENRKDANSLLGRLGVA